MSRWFQLPEMLVTSSGLANHPPPAIRSRIEDTMLRMDQIRDILGKPVRITSGYRSPAVNTAIGGARTSDHMLGCAVDFVCAKMDPKDICRAILAHKPGVEFDQLIAEYRRGVGWVHIGFGERMRQEVLTFRDGKYLPGLV